jgi:hypothetical protein
MGMSRQEVLKQESEIGQDKLETTGTTGYWSFVSNSKVIAVDVAM